MSATVEIYVKYAGQIQVLARRVAEALDATMYRDLGGGFVVPLNAERWIGEPVWAHLDVHLTELGEDGDASFNEGSAYAPYEYVLPLELRGPSEWIVRMGRMIFDRLTGFDLPLAFGGLDAEILADFLPGRRVRELPPGTNAEEPTRALWYVPELHDHPAAPWRPEPVPPVAPPGRVVVFEADGLLQAVPAVGAGGRWRWVAPMAWIDGKRGAGQVGPLLGSALATTAPPDRDDRASIEATLVKAEESIEEFGRRSVSVEVRSDGTTLAVTPHGPYRGGPDEAPSGPVLEDLVRRQAIADLEPAALGELVLDLITAARERVPA